MKNMNGYLVHLEDVFGDIISDTYTTYEIAFCVLVSRESELKDPSVVTQAYIMDNDTGELLFYADRAMNDLEEHGFWLCGRTKNRREMIMNLFGSSMKKTRMNFFINMSMTAMLT